MAIGGRPRRNGRSGRTDTGCTAAGQSLRVGQEDRAEPCRAPVDRQTLQPGRRASKAGLESLRSLSTAQTDDTDRPSPQPTPTLGGKHESHTPGTESRVGWI